MLTLGIETSCDETGVALVEDGKLVAESLASSLTEHIRFGGVIPEIASRAHLEAIPQVFYNALELARIHYKNKGLSLSKDDVLKRIGRVGVTAGPGLEGCLTVGMNFAKGLSLGLDVPFYAVNHVDAHILASALEFELPETFLGLIVSGGHSSLVKVQSLEFDEIGKTIDDAAGECFDKVGRMLGLNYPAGKDIDELAKKGDREKYRFPLPLTGAKFEQNHKYDFSFSGLKTAAKLILEKEQSNSDFKAEDFCASLAKTVAEVLTMKTLKAVQDFEISTVVLGGGFSANSQLREFLENKLLEVGCSLIKPPLKYCTDQGSMIAILTEKLARINKPSSLDLDVNSTLRIRTAQL